MKKIAGELNRIAKDLIADIVTPWGTSQHSASIIRGFTVHSTAGHGGACVSSGLASKLSRYAVKNCTKKDRHGLWFEEDTEIILPVYELGKLYPEVLSKFNTNLEKVEKEVRYWYKDYPFENKR